MRAVTVSPDVDEQGNVSGFNVDSGHYSSPGQRHQHLQDYREDSQGNMHHVMENVEIGGDDGSSFSMEDYAGTLLAENPQLPTIITWAADQPEFSQSEIDSYNKNIFSGEDLKAVHEFIDKAKSLYSEKGGREFPESNEQQPDETDEPPVSDAETEEWFDNISNEVIDSHIDYLMESEFNEDQLEMMEDAMEDFQVDSAEHSILQVGQAVGAGTMSMEDAIEFIVDNFGEASAASAYFRLQQQFQLY